MLNLKKELDLIFLKKLMVFLKNGCPNNKEITQLFSLYCITWILHVIHTPVSTSTPWKINGLQLRENVRKEVCQELSAFFCESLGLITGWFKVYQLAGVAGGKVNKT